ncbi:hypothetical protein [Serratia fonticola]|uniref:hypothetical protein n=1 Tax=Serratia fonticola TaxID=47917 RepID=UPI00301BB5AC
MNKFIVLAMLLSPPIIIAAPVYLNMSHHKYIIEASNFIDAAIAKTKDAPMANNNMGGHAQRAIFSY